VDGEHDLAAPGSDGDPASGLTREERVELLTHRCFVRTRKPHDDLHPYSDRLQPPSS
jgi:hypothetical protein